MIYNIFTAVSLPVFQLMVERWTMEKLMDAKQDCYVLGLVFSDLFRA